MKANYSKGKSSQSANFSSKPIHISVDAEPLKMAYTMLSCGLYHNCEFSWFNPDPRSFDVRYVTPRDLYIGDTITDKNVGSYEDLCKIKTETKADLFSCVCALDQDDTERITLTQMNKDDSSSNLGVFLKSDRANSEAYAKELVSTLLDQCERFFPES